MDELPEQSAALPCPVDSSADRPALLPLRNIEYYEPPRLGIIHLLAVVTVAAVLMKFNLALGSLQEEPSSQSEAQLLVIKLSQAGHAILSAAITVGGIVFWVDRFWRKPGRLQPGHWIVGIDSLAMPAFIFLQVLNVWLQFGRSYSTSNLIFLGYAAFTFPLSLAFGWAAWRLPEPWRWKGALGLIGLVNFVFALYYLTIDISFSYRLTRILDQVAPLFMYVVGGIVLAINVVDFMKRQRRDWLHWLGAIRPMVMVFLYVAFQVAYEWFRQPSPMP